MRPASAARTRLPLSLFSHIGICSVSFDFQTKKRKYKSENKNVRKLRTLLLKHIHIKYKKKKRTTVIFKKEKKRNFALYSLVFVRVDEWWLKFLFSFFFISLVLQSCFFSLNQQYKMNEWLLSVVKKVHTRASRESPSPFLT